MPCEPSPKKSPVRSALRGAALRKLLGEAPKALGPKTWPGEEPLPARAGREVREEPGEEAAEEFGRR